MQDDHFKEASKLIALKRYEQPDDAYFDEFLSQFHRRQRQELLQRSSRSLFMERLGTWYSGANKARLVLGAGVAYAAVFLGAMLVFSNNNELHTQIDLTTIPIEHIRKDMLTPDKDIMPMHETY